MRSNTNRHVRAWVVYFSAVVASYLWVANSAAYDCPTLIKSAAPTPAAIYSNALLWRVTPPNGQASYLYGTIHIADPRVTQLAPAVLEALNDSDSFGMEVVLGLAVVQRLAAAMHYPDRRTLKGTIEEDLYQRTLVLLERYGVAEHTARDLKPWAAYTTLALPPGQMAPPLDLVLMNHAQARGKRIFGLESIDEQIGVFDSLLESDQIELLIQSVCYYDEAQAELEVMIQHYVEHDLGALMKTVFQYKSGVQDRLMASLLWQRNQLMAERLQPVLESGAAFVAIGALHLPGSGGVLDLLDHANYAIEAIY